MRASLLALVASAFVTGCVLPEGSGGSNSVGGANGSGGFSATGGFEAPGGAGGETQHTGGSDNGPHTGGAAASAGGATQSNSTTASNATGGAHQSCGSGTGSDAGACVCNGRCADAGAVVPCPSGWVNADQSCATINVYGCAIKDAVEPPYCSDVSGDSTQHRCLTTIPQYALLSTKLTLGEDARILSLGAVVGSLSTPFRVAIYSDNGGNPDAPLVHTSEQLTYRSPVEFLNPAPTLSAGDYWLTILADPGTEESVYLVADEYSSLDYQMKDATNLAQLWAWPAGSRLAALLVQYTSSRRTLFTSSLLHVYADYVSASASPQ